MKSILLFAAHIMCLLIRCRSQAASDQAAAAVAEGVELYAMAKAIPRLQTLDGASFRLCPHLHYSTCHQADTVNLSPQQRRLLGVQLLGPQVAHPLTLILHKHLSGVPSRVLRAVQIPHARTIGACFRFVCLRADLKGI